MQKKERQNDIKGHNTVLNQGCKYNVIKAVYNRFQYRKEAQVVFALPANTLCSAGRTDLPV